MSWFKRLLTLFKRETYHRHSFRENAWNPYGIAGERRCKCGHYQHTRLDPFKEGSWLEGPHPIAQALRDQGLNSTADPKYVAPKPGW